MQREVTRKVDIAARIFEEHKDFICNVIYTHLYNKELAEDIFQDIFLSLVSRPIDSNISNFKSYLYRTIKNDIIDAARKAKSYENRIHRFTENQKRITPKNNDPVSIIISTEKRRCLFKMVEENLSPSEARAIIHRHKEGLDLEETSEKMKIKKQSVSRYASVGIKKLRLFFQSLEKDDDDA